MSILEKIRHVQNAEYKYKWLLDLEELEGGADKIVNIGCSLGQEPLELVHCFDPSMVVGLDIDEEKIKQSKGRAESIREGLKRIAPDFQLNYVVQDIVSSGFISDYFDLAYCSSVLYQIWDKEDDHTLPKNVLLAVQEMVRITKPGGLIAAKEPLRSSLLQVSDFDFESLFSRVGLHPVSVKKTEALRKPIMVGSFCYRKEDT